MLVRFTGTLVNNVPADYLVKIDFKKVLEVSCRDEYPTNEKPEEARVANFYIDIILEGDEKMTIPFTDPGFRHENIEMLHRLSMGSDNRGFYTKRYDEFQGC